MSVFLTSLTDPTQAAPKMVRQNEASQPVSGNGARLYEAQCIQCHGAQGQGVAGAYPALAQNRAVTMNNPANLVQMVLYGGYAPATAGNPRPFGMPPFVLEMSDREVAEVLSHIRNAWGNQAPRVTELAVTRARAQP
jgi:mono/diheme cytochrome c family protein